MCHCSASLLSPFLSPPSFEHQLGLLGEPLLAPSMAIAPSLREVPWHNTAFVQTAGMALSACPFKFFIPPSPPAYFRKPQTEFPERPDGYLPPFPCLFSAACPGLKGSHEVSLIWVCVIEFPKPFSPYLGGKKSSLFSVLLQIMFQQCQEKVVMLML